MYPQHQVVLSIGSNLGNRLKNIQLAIDTLRHDLGRIISISKLYETDAWGFDGEPFYNLVVLIESEKSPENMMSIIEKIEVNMGRLRLDSKEYQSRIIDIDIICIDSMMINTHHLTVPHKEMHRRLFVLIPFLDLKIDWIHPFLHKNIDQLIADCNDKNNIKYVTDLQTPLHKFDFQKFNFIAIEGNIGVGKTTLVNKIAADFNAKTILEQFTNNPFLPKFYKNQKRYRFLLEMSFLENRHQQLTENLTVTGTQKEFIVADYHLIKSLIFAKVTLSKKEFSLYNNLFNIVSKEIKKPDLLIYLNQNPQTLLENIKNRGRIYEQEIKIKYLEKVNKSYLDYLQSQSNINTLIVDVCGKDFENSQDDYLYILEKIAKH